MIATTRGALLRGSTVDDLGDEVNALAPVATPDADKKLGRDFADFPFSAIERRRSEFDESSNAWRTVRFYVGRCPSYVPVKAGDIIRDAEGKLYAVDEAERMARGLSGRGSVTLTMRRTAP